MKHKKTVAVLVILVVILTVIATLIGIFSTGPVGKIQFTSVNGEAVELYGTGIYKNDSVSMVAQGKAADIVTLFLGVPLLIISLIMFLSGSLRGKIILTGTLGYFLYNYISCVFLWNYNYLFLVYVAIMSLSFFAFIMCMNSLSRENLPYYFRDKLPRKFIGGVQIFIGLIIFLLWLGKIGPAFMAGTMPVGLEHYTTLVIQGLDLGFIVPAALLSGILLIRARATGYLLSCVIILKGITMATSITAMIVGMYLAGAPVNITEVIIFPTFGVLITVCLVLLLKNIDDSKYKQVS